MLQPASAKIDEIFFTRHAVAQDEPSISITTNKQQGGIVVHRIVIDNVNLSLDIADAIVNVILKDRPIVLNAIGSAQEWQVADQYANYLTARAYRLGERNYVYQQDFAVIQLRSRFFRIITGCKSRYGL
jgi:hypothetical protein